MTTKGSKQTATTKTEGKEAKEDERQPAAVAVHRRPRLTSYKSPAATHARQSTHRRVLYRGTAKQYPVKLRNLVVGCQLNCHLPISEFAKDGGETREWTAQQLVTLGVPLGLVAKMCHGYKSPRFTSVVRRLYRPFVTVDVFGTGLAVVTGSKQINQAELALTITCFDMAKSLGKLVTFTAFNQENMVASLGTGFNINQRLFVDDYPAPKTDFHIESFSAVGYFPCFPVEKPVLIIFASGKIVLTGADSWQQIKDLANSVDWKKYELGNEYRKLEFDPILMRAKITHQNKLDAATDAAAAAAGTAPTESKGDISKGMYSLSAAASLSTEAIDSSLEQSLAAPKGSIWAESEETGEDPESLFELQ